MSTIPKWHEFMAPILRVMADGQTRNRSQITDLAADDVGVSAEDRQIALTTGQPKYANRAGWAISHLTLAQALDRPARGAYVIAEAGMTLLAQYPEVTRNDVEAVTGYRRRQAVTDPQEEQPSEAAVDSLNPDELIDRGMTQIHQEVAAELLKRLHANDPAFFEQAVLDLLMAMGYGGAEGRATRTQLVGDGGIDGIIDQDALGLSRVYVQAKRYALDASIGRPEIQGFVGALHGNQASQGVFITTARYSRGARDFADSVATRVVLVDGERLATLMIRYGVGVQTKRSVEIVEIDEDFFD